VVWVPEFSPDYFFSSSFVSSGFSVGLDEPSVPTHPSFFISQAGPWLSFFPCGPRRCVRFVLSRCPVLPLLMVLWSLSLATQWRLSTVLRRTTVLYYAVTGIFSPPSILRLFTYLPSFLPAPTDRSCFFHSPRSFFWWFLPFPRLLISFFLCLDSLSD